MSDLTGESAFDNVMDRLLDLNTRLDTASRERNEARAEKYELERRVRLLESQFQTATAEAARFKALIPAKKLAAAERVDDIPF